MPSSPWPFMSWEAKAPEPCEEANPCRACTEVWVRDSAASPYDGFLGGPEVPSTVSLPPASSRSLPTRRSLQHTRLLSAIQEPEPPADWLPSLMLQKMCAVLPLCGPSTASTKGERAETTVCHAKAGMPHHVINPSVDPRQIASDDFGYSQRSSDAAGTSFMLPSTLQAAQYHPVQLGAGCAVGWQDSPETAIRPLSSHDDTDSDDETYDAWDPMPTRQLSSNALARLEGSLRNALDNASASGWSALPTASDARGHGRANGQAMYP